ncbi:MAG: hypothetical protein SF069_11195 [Phycisphaerae bacterium]|nr:hypothetical protein [Phycisphaerae bacterium]
MLSARSIAQKLRFLSECLPLSGRSLRFLAAALFAGGGAAALALEAGSILRGDLNRDGVVNYDDMEAFVQAVNEPAAWRARFGADEATRREAGDFSRDGVVDSADVRGFSAAIIVGEQQSRRAPAKPEAAPTPESIDSQGEAVVDARSISTCDPWCNNAAPCVYERVFVDLDIDSDNNDGVALPQRTELEDCIEDRGACGQDCCCAGLLNPPGVFPGPKRIQPNTDDDDSDGRPDFAQDVGQPIAGESGELTPMVLEIIDPYVPHTDNPNTACVERPFGSYQLTYGDPSRPGVIRLWRKGDRTGYVEPGVWYHDLQPYGDMNLDGFVTGYDISLFVLMLTNPASVPWNDPWVSAEEVADMNGDGFVTVADISLFIQTVSQSIPMRPIPKRFWVELLPLSSLAGNHVELTVQADYDAFGGDPNFGLGTRCADGNTDWWGALCCESFETGGPSRDQVRLQAACGDAFDWDFAATTVDADTCLNDTQSRCWFPTLDEDNPDWIGGGAYHRPPGYPLQLDLAVGFGPPDLPPRSVDPWESSLALVPGDARSSSGPSPYL